MKIDEQVSLAMKSGTGQSRRGRVLTTFGTWPEGLISAAREGVIEIPIRPLWTACTSIFVV
jgi:hypothetical protein